MHQSFRRGKPTFAVARAVSSTSRSTDEPRPFGPFDVRNKIMIVTGGARGLGLEIADQLYDAGAHGEQHSYCYDWPEFVTAQQRNSQLGGSLRYERVDITDASTVDDIIYSITVQHGQIHGLVANAGVTLTLDAVEHTEADVEKIWRCNFWGAFLCATAVGRQMLEQKTRGSILLVASMSGLIANKGIFSSAYNCSKAAQLVQIPSPENTDNSCLQLPGGLPVGQDTPGVEPSKILASCPSLKGGMLHPPRWASVVCQPPSPDGNSNVVIQVARTLSNVGKISSVIRYIIGENNPMSAGFLGVNAVFRVATTSAPIIPRRENMEGAIVT
ncbi:hypothetical protein DTO027I6_9865 [Penicillium roqueforti]|nr:hypothetical protein CBS147337_10068 [Penicillium roqueforti]KAI3185010.1 hypothetical protein DTO027I6_9865 [Penicillium roqueforti]